MNSDSNLSNSVSKSSRTQSVYNENFNFDDCFQKNLHTSLFDKIQEERDFYHNECHRLKEELTKLPWRTDNVR